jgi:drug/metabolite transporter, DME family
VAMTSVPVFTGLIAVVLRRGGVSPRWLIATTLAITGAGLLAFARPDGRSMTVGVLVALAAGVSYAVFTAASAAVIQRGGPPGTTMAVVFLTSGLLLSPMLVLHPPGWLLTHRGAGVIGYLVVVASAIAYVLMGRGLRTTAPATASTLVLVEPACAALIGILLLNEPMTGRSVIGLVVLTAALLILVLGSRGDESGVVAGPRAEPAGVP